MPKLIVNTLLFQLGWFACVFGGDSLWLLSVAAMLAVHLLWTSSWAAEGKLLITVFLAGSALDSFLLNLGVFDFGEPRTLIPLWLASVRLAHHCPITAARRSQASACPTAPGKACC